MTVVATATFWPCSLLLVPASASLLGSESEEIGLGSQIYQPLLSNAQSGITPYNLGVANRWRSQKAQVIHPLSLLCLRSKLQALQCYQLVS